MGDSAEGSPKQCVNKRITAGTGLAQDAWRCIGDSVLPEDQEQKFVGCGRKELFV